MSKRCDNDDGTWKRILRNGDVEQRLCDGCFDEAVLDLVKSNAKVTFTHETAQSWRVG